MIGRATLVSWFRYSACVVGLAVLVPQAAKCSADVLIVENVERLRVLNKYQQEATPGDRRALVPFVPMRILNANETLADGFTRCTQVEIEGEVFYLLKDSVGELWSTDSLGYKKTFNVTTLLDTVQILTANTIRFSPVRLPASTLPKGEIIIRMFHYRNSTYCRTIGASQMFGWVDFSTLNERHSWSLLKRTASQTASLSSLALSKIQVRLKEANMVLSRLYSFFNNQTHDRKPPPQWNILSSEKAILCTLEGTQAENEFRQSTAYLSNEIENVLLGSAFQVTHAPGRIEIKPK